MDHETPDLQFRTIDLVFNVTGTGGTVQDLEVNETPGDSGPGAHRPRRGCAVRFRQIGDHAERGGHAGEGRGNHQGAAKGSVRIDGYTGGKGGAAYNLASSERRANVVRHWLRSRDGLAKVTFETGGLGAANPVAPNQNPDGSDNPEGRRKNRRVEITIAK